MHANHEIAEHHGKISAQDGLRLFYRDYGSARAAATPVLCLSGLTRNSRDFAALARRLGVKRRVVCLDYRGRGKSEYDPVWQNYHPATYVNDVRHVLAALGLHRVFVVGTSLGGLLTMAMGSAVPMVLAGALINDVGPELGGDGLSNIMSYMMEDGSLPDWESVTALYKKCFPNLPAYSEEDWLTIAKGGYREDEAGRIVRDWDAAILKPFASYDPTAVDLWPLFRSIGSRPCVAVRGALSDILADRTFDRMADELPGLVRITVPGVGHAPALSETEVLEALDGALDEVDRTYH